jgi:hypothetical protein
LGTDKKRQGPAGRIVNISSSGAKVAIPLLGAYSASKFGLEGMSDALRRELMLFGIDVVIIEPGTVNTAMYDKGEKEDLSEFKPTAYWEAVQKFQKFIVTEARTNGLSPERLGEAVHVALSSAKPKVRYAVIPQRFKNWILPRLLPARMVDAQLAKMLGLTKPSRPGTAGLTSHDEGKPRIVEREHGAIGAALARSACQFLAASLGTARLPRRRPALTTVLDGRSSKPPDRPAANPCKSATLVSHDTLCAAR